MIYNQDRRTGLYLPDGARPQASGYSEAGASRTRRALKGFDAHSGSPNEDINWNNYPLRQRGRMLYMSSPLATSAINTNRTKAVGIGLTLKPAIDRETLGLSPEAAEESAPKVPPWKRTWTMGVPKAASRAATATAAPATRAAVVPPPAP